jgi:hypothetical protein
MTNMRNAMLNDPNGSQRSRSKNSGVRRDLRVADAHAVDEDGDAG